MKKAIWVAAALACATGMAFADSSIAPKALRLYGGIGLTLGGDDLSTVQYSGGSTSDVKAGQGFQISGGIDYRWSETVSTQLSVGYHVSGLFAENGSVSFKRIPVELLGYYHLDNNWRVGGGVRFVSGAHLGGSGAGVGYVADQDADSTVGYVVEGEYFFSPNLGLKIRGVQEKYNFEILGSKQASHVGAFFSLYY